MALRETSRDTGCHAGAADIPTASRVVDYVRRGNPWRMPPHDGIRHPLAAELEPAVALTVM